jgi:hypothetical protein
MFYFPVFMRIMPRLPEIMPVFGMAFTVLVTFTHVESQQFI